jgi:hypothetical protein
MKLLAVLFSVLAVLTAFAASDQQEQPESPAPAPNGIEMPDGYLAWSVLSVSTRSDNGTLRVILGNDAAIAAADSGRTKPWPNGTILCKLVWKQIAHEVWPAAGVPGEFVHAEFMVKDSGLYSSTGGWGFARWLGLDQTPYGADAGFVNECFGCHQPVAEQDYVFTHPAIVPGGAALVPN